MNNTTKEHPLILNAQEVNAVLAGNKSQHRVPIKMRYGSPDFLGSRDCNKSDPSLWGWDNFEDSEIRVLSNEPCPFGAIGDRLWAQELHARTENKVLFTAPHYYAEGPLTLDLRHDAGLLTKYSADDMPRWASRLLLETTDIRIERVQDISEADAIAMGLKPDYCDHKYQTCEDIGCIGKWAGALFLHLRHDKKLAVHYTDWVWVIELKVVELKVVELKVVEPSEVKL